MENYLIANEWQQTPNVRESLDNNKWTFKCTQWERKVSSVCLKISQLLACHHRQHTTLDALDEINQSALPVRSNQRRGIIDDDDENCVFIDGLNVVVRPLKLKLMPNGKEVQIAKCFHSLRSWNSQRDTAHIKYVLAESKASLDFIYLHSELSVGCRLANSRWVSLLYSLNVDRRALCAQFYYMLNGSS